MKITINFSQFQAAFVGDIKGNFSYDGLAILFAHLEEVERGKYL